MTFSLEELLGDFLSPQWLAARSEKIPRVGRPLREVRELGAQFDP